MINPTAPARTDGRVPYEELSADEREALHEWLRLHGIVHTTVPVDAPFAFDEPTGEWLITVHELRDGRPFVGPDGKAATEVLRRRELAPLPWRMADDG
jgi:hypothetical protein